MNPKEVIEGLKQAKQDSLDTCTFRDSTPYYEERVRKQREVLSQAIKDLTSQEQAELRLPENPYPEDIFPEPSQEKYDLINKKLKEIGITPDSYNGSFGRKVWNNFTNEVTPILSKALRENEELKNDLEQERVRLAGCLCVAEGHIDEKVKQGVYGWSLPYERIKELRQNLHSTKQELESLKKSKLTKEEFRTIACEYRPSIAEDSQQPEWCQGELDELFEALTKGKWLYINRDQQVEKLKQELERIKGKLTVENLERIREEHLQDVAKSLRTGKKPKYRTLTDCLTKELI